MALSQYGYNGKLAAVIFHVRKASERKLILALRSTAIMAYRVNHDRGTVIQGRELSAEDIGLIQDW